MATPNDQLLDQLLRANPSAEAANNARVTAKLAEKEKEKEKEADERARRIRYDILVAERLRMKQLCIRPCGLTEFAFRV